MSHPNQTDKDFQSDRQSRRVQLTHLFIFIDLLYAFFYRKLQLIISIQEILKHQSLASLNFWRSHEKHFYPVRSLVGIVKFS
ncbi:hypothetical protein C789_3242 [Microcystis aeruginosa FACHB-905 = DIANCHI905]|nr:hypothetical protein C789_3242 [Microcystis aeruginosa FACHB-905 = DIANCHI905]